jgi:transmembrane sensor
MNRDPRSSGDKARRDAAIEWLSRIKAGTITRSDHKAFEAWLEADNANRAAFDKSSALWGELGGVLLPAAAVAAPASRRTSWLATAALAAALFSSYFGKNLAILWRADFSTGVGELKTVTLEDGSRIELNADTAIAKHYSRGQRGLTLLKGEAWFAVARDPGRPFVVEAAGGTTTALGTSFDVAMTDGGAQVSVTEHKVAVAAAGQVATVEEGQQLSYGADRPVLLAARPTQVENDTAWRRGYLVFNEKPLGEVIAAINRHFHGYCLIVAPSIRSRKVSGLFWTAEPLESIRAIELSLGVHVAYFGNYLVVLWS